MPLPPPPAAAAAQWAQHAYTASTQAAAAQVAQSLGYNVAPVGVPTAAAYGDLPAAAPPYGLSTPNPAPVMGMAGAWELGPAAALPAVLAQSMLAQLRALRAAE